eukprot:7941824-Prorocentrum_lima.AAC.1
MALGSASLLGLQVVSFAYSTPSCITPGASSQIDYFLCDQGISAFLDCMWAEPESPTSPHRP